MYETKKKQLLYVGQVQNRFLYDEGGLTEELMLKCLKPFATDNEQTLKSILKQ